MKVVLFKGDSYEVECLTINGFEDPRFGDDIEDRVEKLRYDVVYGATWGLPHDVEFGFVDIPDSATDYRIRAYYYDDTKCKEYVEYVVDGKIHDVEVDPYEWREF